MYASEVATVVGRGRERDRGGKRASERIEESNTRKI